MNDLEAEKILYPELPLFERRTIFLGNPNLKSLKGLGLFGGGNEGRESQKMRFSRKHAHRREWELAHKLSAFPVKVQGFHGGKPLGHVRESEKTHASPDAVRPEDNSYDHRVHGRLFFLHVHVYPETFLGCRGTSHLTHGIDSGSALADNPTYIFRCHANPNYLVSLFLFRAGNFHGVGRRDKTLGDKFDESLVIGHDCLLPFLEFIQYAGFFENSPGRIGRLSTVPKPLYRFFRIHRNFRRTLERIVRSNHLDESSVPGRAGIRHHKPVVGSLFPAMTR
jgi:hypothetical protein